MASSQQERDQVAQEMFGKNFDECESMERIKVGAHIGGKRGGGRIHEMAQERREGQQGRGETEAEEQQGMEGEEEGMEEEGVEEGMEGEEQGMAQEGKRGK
ncbi:hypothetical protein PLESTM_000053800 [Pleodorina starrii]|nr:hypothetical protein PLESTM_000053800 [Pleodorina starrii]